MRFFLPILASLSLVCPVLAPAALAQTQPTHTTPLQNRIESRALVQKLLSEGKIMRPSEAKRGMKGYALSVFQGVKIERFNLEVLGTLERVQGGGDLVMIKVLDGPVVQRQSGIIQGMSGSPVYINGKLLGAIAIGFGFPKEPIGGVTPITQMIETGLPDNSVPPKPTKMAKLGPAALDSYRAKTSFEVANRKIDRVLISSNPKVPHFTDASTMTMRPCTRLVMLSGVSPQNLERWKKTFEPYGITPMIGAGGMMGGSRQAFGISSRKTGVKADLRPGAAIGVQMASGDIDATGVGTVTFRDGNRVLAFGHPMFNLGGVSMPMTTAFVHDIFPSYDTSFKLASPMVTVGELQRDNNFSVGGTVGRVAQTIPLRIRIVDADKKIDRKINVRLIKDPLFTPELLQNIALEAVQSTVGLDSAKTVKVDLGIALTNGPTIRRQNTTYAGEAVIQGALGELLDAVSITQQNPFDKGAFKSIDLSVNIIPGRKTARIRRVFADRNRIKAGEKVTISVVIEPSNEPDVAITRRFVLPIPADTPKGILRVAVSPADAYWAGRGRVGGTPPRPGTLRELLDAYAKIGASNTLLLQASTPNRFLLVDRKKVSDPPALWNRLVPVAPSTSLGSFNETVEQRQPSEYVLSGLESINIPVDSLRYSDQTPPEAASSDSGSAASSSDSTPTAVASETDADEIELATDLDFHGRNLNWLRKLNLNFPTAISKGSNRANTPAIVPARQPLATTSASATATPTATPSPSPTPDASANNIARPVGRWIQKTATDFRHGDFKNALVRDDGTILGGPNSKLVVSSGEPVAWSVASAGNAIYVGTGHSARLLKIQNGQSKVLYEGAEVAISALATDSDGNVYAGVSPGGRVYRFAPDGTRTTILQTGESFVHALAWQGSELIAATGGARGAIYKIVAPKTAILTNATATPFATVSQKHVKSLSVLGDSIYAGTGDEAVLYRVDTTGQATALYQPGTNAQSSAVSNASESAGSTTVIVISGGATGGTQQSPLLTESGASASSGSSGNEILSVCAIAGKDGAPATIYFGTLSSGSVWSYVPGRGVAEVWKSAGRSIYSLAKDDNGNLIVGADGGEVWRLSFDGDDTRAARLLDANQPQVLALNVTGDRILAATANNAAIYEISAQQGATATFTSNVFDAGQIVRFGSLRSLGSGYTIESRSGNTIDPDETWSAFQPLVNGQIASPSARFLQYRATLDNDGQLNRVEVLYRAPNRAPKVVWNLGANLDYISGKKTLNWTGTDPDTDVLRSTVELARAEDANRDWKPVEVKTPTASTVEFDSTKFADGLYVLRVAVSDAARNPDDPKRDSAVSNPVVIDNTAPVLGAIFMAKTADGWTISGDASDATSPIAGAEWRVLPADAPKRDTTPKATTTKSDSTPAITPASPVETSTAANGTVLWQAFSAADGIFDSKKESIVTNVATDIPGVKVEAGSKIEVRLRDAAGNQTTSTVVLNNAK